MTVPLEVTPVSTERFQSGAFRCLVDTITVALLFFLRAADESAFMPRGVQKKAEDQKLHYWDPMKKWALFKVTQCENRGKSNTRANQC